MTATSTNKKMSEHKQILTELEDLYNRAFTALDNRRKEKHPEPYLCGWTWWSLPPKMWRIAKSLGFKNYEYNHEWKSLNTISGYGDYSASMAAQKIALEELRKKHPDSILLQNISSCGRLD